MGLVIRRLYFGNATRKEIGMNGRILRDLHAEGYDWEYLAQVVEGLAIRRDRGELGIRRDDPVSLRWLISHRQFTNQLPVSADAVYREKPRVVPKREGEMTTMSSILSQLAKGA
jgi:hypothetical protein